MLELSVDATEVPDAPAIDQYLVAPLGLTSGGVENEFDQLRVAAAELHQQGVDCLVLIDGDLYRVRTCLFSKLIT